MNHLSFLITIDPDPWTYLAPSGLGTKVLENLNEYGFLWSGLYFLIYYGGIGGCVITAIWALIKMAMASSPAERNKLKNDLIYKALSIFLLSLGAWIFATILGVIVVL